MQCSGAAVQCRAVQCDAAQCSAGGTVQWSLAAQACGRAVAVQHLRAAVFQCGAAAAHLLVSNDSAAPNWNSASAHLHIVRYIAAMQPMFRFLSEEGSRRNWETGWGDVGRCRQTSADERMPTPLALVRAHPPACPGVCRTATGGRGRWICGAERRDAERRSLQVWQRIQQVSQQVSQLARSREVSQRSQQAFHGREKIRTVQASKSHSWRVSQQTGKSRREPTSREAEKSRREASKATTDKKRFTQSSSGLGE